MPNAAQHKYPDRKKMTPEEIRRAGSAAQGKTIEERFWPRVDRDGHGPGCHDWLGAITWQGYGQLWYLGKMRRSHQVAWLLAGNELPKEPYVLHHKCHNTLCVNVDHLEVTTRYDNAVTYSNSAWGENARKTHCVRGHPFDEANTIYGKSPKGRQVRQCKACKALYPSTGKRQPASDSHQDRSFN